MKGQKHLEIDFHFFQEKILSGVIKVVHMRTAFQLVDILTKALHPARFQFLISKIELQDIYATHLEGESAGQCASNAENNNL